MTTRDELMAAKLQADAEAIIADHERYAYKEAPMAQEQKSTALDLKDAVFAYLEAREPDNTTRDFEEFVSYVEVAVKRVEDVERAMRTWDEARGR